MRSYHQSTRDTSEVYGFVAGLLRRHLPWRDYGRVCPISTLLAVLLFAAARQLSLSAAADQLRDAPSDETVRNALIQAARTIGSEYERGRVLSAVIK